MRRFICCSCSRRLLPSPHLARLPVPQVPAEQPEKIGRTRVRCREPRPLAFRDCSAGAASAAWG